MFRTLAALLSLTAAPVLAQDEVRQRGPEEEVIYFVLPDRFENGDTSNDRGGLSGGKLDHGFDPTHRGFYNGGDLAGLTKRLDYLEGLGITAIWFAPIFKNKPVQGDTGQESAGYHGYWVTDFTSIDPHFGTNEEFKAFVDAAHARGMKVYMDIITNHTADVIQTKSGEYAYRSIADYPYTTRGGPDGAPINEGFEGDQVMTAENFAKLTNPNWAYEVVVPEAEKNVKVPAWLNDPIYYHNRGNSDFFGEDSLYGDFAGLDDLMTENPLVVGGMIEIFKGWIEKYGVDGFRIDTARHVNPEFWQYFAPAMTATAKSVGIHNFTQFGEVFRDDSNPGYIAMFTRRDRFPAVLDFAFQQSVRELLGQDAPTAVIARMFEMDALYAGGHRMAKTLPTFLGNHDMGRFSTLIKADRPGISQDELLQRVLLGHAMMLTLRGAPTIYYGDEQGFVGDGHDQMARENMFASRVDEYNDNDLIGTDATTADENFDTAHPIYREVAVLANMRTSTPALTKGDQVTRAYKNKPGLFAASRFDPTTGKEIVLLFNTSTEAISGNVLVETGSMEFNALAGQCSPQASAPGSLAYALAPLSYAVCEAK